MAIAECDLNSFRSASQSIPRHGAGSLVLVVYNDFRDLSTTQSDDLTILSRLDVGKFDGRGEGCKRYWLAATTAALFKVLNDEFGTGFTKASGLLVLKVLCYSLARRCILQCRAAAGQRGSDYGDANLVALGDIEAREVVCTRNQARPNIILCTGVLTRDLGIPLIPSVIRAVAVPVNTSLQDGGLAGIAIDTNPGGSGSIGATTALRHVDGSGCGSEPRASEDSTAPVGLNGRVGLVAYRHTRCRASRTTTTPGLLARLTACQLSVGQCCRQGDICTEQCTQDSGSGNLHGDNDNVK